MTGRPLSHTITYLPIGCKIISHLVCKWALQSMTFQKQVCKCLVPNQSLCKLMKEQFGFICHSFVLVWFGLFVCQSNSVYQCGTERRENSKLHATQATCQFDSWKSYQAIIPQLQCERVMNKPFTVLQNRLFSLPQRSVSYICTNRKNVLCCKWRFWYIVSLRPQFASLAGLNGRQAPVIGTSVHLVLTDVFLS